MTDPVIHAPGELGRLALCNKLEKDDRYYAPFGGWRELYAEDRPLFDDGLENVTCAGCLKLVEDHFDPEQPDCPPRVPSCGTCVHHGDDDGCYALPPTPLVVQYGGSPEPRLWPEDDLVIQYRVTSTAVTHPPCIHWRATK